LRAINSQDEKKTKEYIADKLVVVVEEVGAKNVVQIITNNAANCKCASLIVQQKYDNNFWTPCVVHTLNLALKIYVLLSYQELGKRKLSLLNCIGSN
jgi:hypothetical protein